MTQQIACSSAQPQLISSKEEVEELASELANHYIDYLNIDISREQRKYEDSIEECLAHLEEVCSALDGYKQNSEGVIKFVDTIISKSDYLNKLYEQVDALEQYVFETNRLLDQLDKALEELESHRNPRGNKIRQIIGILPRLSNMPRLGLFNNLSGFFDDTPPNFVDSENMDDDTPQITPIGDILHKISHIESSLAMVTSSLHARLHGKVTEPVSELNDSVSSLSLASPEQVDGSWQELL